MIHLSKPHSTTCETLVQGSDPSSPQRKCRILTTGPMGESLAFISLWSLYELGIWGKGQNQGEQLRGYCSRMHTRVSSDDGEFRSNCRVNTGPGQPYSSPQARCVSRKEGRDRGEMQKNQDRKTDESWPPALCRNFYIWIQDIQFSSVQSLSHVSLFASP